MNTMQKNGIYVSPTEFVQFAQAPAARKLSDQIATRERSPNFTALGLYLPNPDPILKKQGKDMAVYRDLRADAHVGGCIRRRKAAVKAMEWRVDKAGASARMVKLAEQVLQALDMDRFINETTDAVLYGWQPMEVQWSSTNNPRVPVRIWAKPGEWFHFDAQSALRFRSREQPLYGEALEARKFLVPTQEASYANPYGHADLSMCFWPTVFKRGGLKFWVTYAEKFGTPWMVGKLPPGTAAKEQNELLGKLEDMVQDAVAVIPDNASIAPIEAGDKAGSSSLYENLLMFCRSEVSIALLGQNQSTEASATNASAQAGLEVTASLRDGDARLVEANVNLLLRWLVDLNEGEQATAPKFQLFEQKELDLKLAQRDETLTKAGVLFTRNYWQRAYDLADDDLAQVPEPPAPTQPLPKKSVELSATAFAESVLTGASVSGTRTEAVAKVDEISPIVSALDAIDALVDAALNDWEPLMSPMVDPLQAAMDESAAKGETAGELLARLPALLGSMNADALARALTHSAFTARIGALAGLSTPAP